jgi:class 3 adenylate cyclase
MLSSLTGFLKARLSRRIVLWVFASIVAIEAIILIPSYYRRENELLQQLEEVSEAAIRATVRWRKQGIAGDMLMAKLENLVNDPIILGIAVYRPDGQRLETIGEPPEIDFSELRDPEKYLICARERNGDRYDVAWSAQTLGANYVLIVRHDASSVQRELFAFTLRIAGLVLLISAFVTGTTTIVLGFTVIVPILQLRNDLIAAGEALARHDRTNPDFYSHSVTRRDELGEVTQAFNQMYRRVSSEIEQRQQAEAVLRAEQEKSERLLLNILPEPIARQLKEGRSSIANGFAEATILFADLVNFTQLSERKSPTQLVELLNEIFSAFDRLTEQHGLEKIKTIGDAYMVVGGLPVPRHDHAQAVAEMALDMQREVARLSREQGETFNIRIGINTGPVVAGVIGTKKFIYDLWGDAVNTASRMESHGIAGAIQVTESTYERLQDNYRFQERGVIQVKGKGEMTTYFLLGKKVEHLVS